MYSRFSDSAYNILSIPVSYTHLRAHETVLDLVCRLLLEKKKAQALQDKLSAYLLVHEVKAHHGDLAAPA